MTREEAYLGGDVRLNRADDALVGSVIVPYLILNRNVNPLIFNGLRSFRAASCYESGVNLFIMMSSSLCFRSSSNRISSSQPFSCYCHCSTNCCGNVIVDANLSYLGSRNTLRCCGDLYSVMLS